MDFNDCNGAPLKVGQTVTWAYLDPATIDEVGMISFLDETEGIGIVLSPDGNEVNCSGTRDASEIRPLDETTLDPEIVGYLREILPDYAS